MVVSVVVDFDLGVALVQIASLGSLKVLSRAVASVRIASLDWPEVLSPLVVSSSQFGRCLLAYLGTFALVVNA